MPSLALSFLRTDGGTQPRAALRQDWVEEFAGDMEGGAEFPSVVAFYDGTDHWLADGFHRVAAARQVGWTNIEVDVRQGTQRDAILFSVSANSTHGQRRTNEDKRRAVLTLLNDTEWSGWSDREIGRRCGVTHPFVSSLRPSEVAHTGNGYQSRSFTHPRTGKPTEMNTARIGRRVAAEASAAAAIGGHLATERQFGRTPTVQGLRAAVQDAVAETVGPPPDRAPRAEPETARSYGNPHTTDWIEWIASVELLATRAPDLTALARHTPPLRGKLLAEARGAVPRLHAWIDALENAADETSRPAA